jgi:hypothetical protein
MRWAGYVVHMEEVYKILVGKPKEKTTRMTE